MLIDYDKVKVYQQDKLILDDVSFHANEGEFIYLIGKVGSGKSSLLKTLYCELDLYPEEAEKAEVLGRIGSAKYTIQRSKGLGENDPDMMSRTTMHPATRRLVRVSPDDEIKTYEMFDVLLGDNLQGRKRFIAENGAKYLDLADY